MIRNRSPRRIATLAGSVGCLVLLAGCVVLRSPGRNLPPPPAPEAFDYRFLPGDRIKVQLLYTPQLSQEVLVQPDGKITLPVVGTIRAAGLTVPDLTEQLKDGFSRDLERPEVSIQMVDFGGQRVYVGGEVRTPRMLPLDTVMSVADAVFAAGGLMDTAADDSVIVLRRGADGAATQAFQVDLDAGLYGQADLSRLQPFDVVFVPKTPIAHLNTYVEQYINRMIPRNVSFSAIYGIP